MRSGFADYHECKIANVRKSAIVFGILLIVASLTFGCFTFGWMSYLQLKNQAFIDWDFACVMSGSELLGALIGSVFSRKMYEIEPTGFGPVPKPLLNIRRWQLF